MGLIWGILGLIVGAGITFWLLQQKLEEKTRENASNLNRLREELEQAHESRLQEAIRSLQADYDRQLQNRENSLKQSYEAELQGKIALIQVEKQQELERAIANRQPSPQPSKPEEIPAELPQTDTPTAIPTESLETEGLEKTPVSPPSDPEEMQDTEVVAPSAPVSPTAVAPPKPQSITLEKTQQPILKEKSPAITSIAQLNTLIYARDEQVRAQIASTLGQLAKNPLVKRELDQTLNVLEKLCRDSSAIVRYQAVEALGQIESDRAIAPLQQALHDVDSNVAKAASTALNRFKFYPVRRPKTLPSNGVKQQKP